jgi:hypothetical protein
LSLWHNRKRPSRLVKAMAEDHIQALEQKTQELLAMKSTFVHLVRCCQGDDRPECPILDVPASNEARCRRPQARKGRRTPKGGIAAIGADMVTGGDVRRMPLRIARSYKPESLLR